MRYFSCLLLAVCASLLLSSCKKTEDDPSSIVGSWKLVEVYADPGDGSGTFRKIDGEKTLEFRSDGKAEVHNGDFCRINLQSTNNEISDYSITNGAGGADMKLIFDKCEMGPSFSIRGDILTIYYQCIEGCGEKFVRIQ